MHMSMSFYHSDGGRKAENNILKTRPYLSTNCLKKFKYKKKKRKKKNVTEKKVT